MRWLAIVVLGFVSLAACEDKPGRSEPAPVERPRERVDESAPAPEAPAMIDPSVLSIANRIDLARYIDDLRFVAAERAPGSSHWQAVQDRCAQTLEQAGFTVERFSVEGAGVNVIGTLRGSQPELPPVMVGAHYDHIPGCPGANDNGSGVAGLLELARAFGRAQQPEGWTRTLMMACWDEEEAGLLGSKAWVDRLVAGQGPSDEPPIRLYLNFDTMGYADQSPNSQRLPPGIEVLFPNQFADLQAREFRADFIGVLADSRADATAKRMLIHAERLGLPTVALTVPDMLKNAPALADLRRSDHASFWSHDIPAVFLSDTADFRSDSYHCAKRPDTVDTVDLEFVIKVVRASASTLAELLRT